MKSWVGIGGREGKTECSLCGDECESCVMGMFSI